MFFGSRAFSKPGKTAALSALAGWLAILGPLQTLPAQPIVSGYERWNQHPDRFSGAQRGELLLAELGCVACHGVDAVTAERLDSRVAPDLGAIAKRVAPAYLHRFLADPQAAKPGTPMPNVLHGLSPEARSEEVDALVHFLATLQSAGTQSSETGLPSKTEDSSNPPGVSAVGVESVTVADGSEAAEIEIEMGRKHFATRGCVACHAPPGPPPARSNEDPSSEDPSENSLPSVPLGDLAAKTTVRALQNFLLNPHRVRPLSRMPLFRLNLTAARELAVYLLRDQFPRRGTFSPTPGLVYEHVPFEAADASPNFDEAANKPPTRTGMTPWQIQGYGVPEQHVAIRFSGELEVAEAGDYEFWVETFGSATLSLDGRDVVTVSPNAPQANGVSTEAGRPQSSGSKSSPNSGVGKIRIEAGSHPIQLNYYNREAEAHLRVEWSGPSFARQGVSRSVLFNRVYRPMLPLDPTPLRPDGDKVRRGAQLFVERGCIHCHALEEFEGTGRKGVSSPAKPLVLTAPARGMPSGCLGTAVAADRPDYGLSATQRSDLAAALRALAAPPRRRTAAEVVDFTFASRGCIACHTRDGWGGPRPPRADYFTSLEAVDLGEEARLPPDLTGVGDKLLPEALRTIIHGPATPHAARLLIRPYLSTTMPTFPSASLPDLAASLIATDRVVDARKLSAASPEAIRDGRHLLGEDGLSCVSCHSVHQRASVGVRGVDLGQAPKRLNPDWFPRFLGDPQQFKPSTRMPSYWTEGNVPAAETAGGIPFRQQEALWHYLVEGAHLEPPEATGAAMERYELVPEDRALVLRCLLWEAGPRAIAVGFPAGVHFAFDAQQVRLAKIWRGAFFNAGGTWHGRRTYFLQPSGTDVLDLPDGPTLATLSTPNTPWPQGTREDRDTGGQFRGYDLNPAREPTFRYELDGLSIREHPAPWKESGSNFIRRAFTVLGEPSEGTVYFLAGRGKQIEAGDDGFWDVDGRYRVRLHATPPLPPHVRHVDGQAELLVPLDGTREGRNFEVFLKW